MWADVSTKTLPEWLIHKHDSKFSQSETVWIIHKDAGRKFQQDPSRFTVNHRLILKGTDKKFPFPEGASCAEKQINSKSQKVYTVSLK